jgi:hypothetical protein
MDWTPKGSWASLVVIADVTTSMYFGNGRGFVGTEGDQLVSDLSRDLLHSAEEHLDVFEPNTSVDLPADGLVRITVLTHHGRRVAEAPETDLHEASHPAAPVGVRAQKVITAVRSAVEGTFRPKQPEGATMMMAAAYKGNVPALLWWFKVGTDLEVRDIDGYTALMYAANKGRDEAVRVLLAHGADPNATDNQMTTPIMFAAQRGYDGIISQLLAAGARPNARGDLGFTALGLARRHRHESTAALLIAAGAFEDDDHARG